MALPVNVDSTYADSGTDASVALHQQHHDTIHKTINALPDGQGVIAQTGGTFKGTVGVPGAYFIAAAGTQAMTAGRTVYAPMFLAAPMTLKGIYLSVTLAVASSTVKAVIYSADSTWTPGAAFYTSAAISSATTGDKVLDLSASPVTVPAGRYLLALWPSDAITVRYWPAANREIAWRDTTLTAACVMMRATTAATSAPADPSGFVDPSAGNGPPGLWHFVLLGWSG